jgi:hypothetical protein
MRTVTETAIIRGSQEEVFRTAADPEVQLRWDPGTLKSVEKLTPGPLAQGSRYRGRFKGYGTVEFEFADYDPPHRFAHRARMPLGTMNHVFTFQPVPDGTRLTQEGRLEPRGIGRVFGPLMMGALRRRFRTIARELGDYLGRA